ncbi:5'/3'-nucleotidase SurE [Verrucomicrobiota bacterium]
MTPLILVTNDDGIDSPGLRAAVEAVVELGDIVVVAPSNQQTSMSRSLCGAPDEYLRPIDYKVNDHSVTAYHADCSPARLVLHAMEVLFKDKKPDLVVSGINYGENLGSNLSISGTVGAAVQAASAGVRSIAVALQTEIGNHHKHAKLDWRAAQHFTALFAGKMIEHEHLPWDADILNINVPSNATAETKWTITKQSKEPYFSNLIENSTPSSKLGDGKCVIALDEESLDPSSDIYAIYREHIVSVTPLSIDITSRVDINKFEALLRRKVKKENA